MKLASDDTRDVVANGIADFFGWLFDGLGRLFTDGPFGLGVVLGLALLFIVWRVTLVIFPEKRCWRCRGEGEFGLGSLRRECSTCKGKGRVSRMGS